MNKNVQFKKSMLKSYKNYYIFTPVNEKKQHSKNVFKLFKLLNFETNYFFSIARFERQI